MLYVTTRNDQDAFTAHHALTECRGPDGGAYVPLHDPALPLKELLSLGDGTDGGNGYAALTLNSLLGTEMNAGDIRLSCGKRPLNIFEIDRKTVAVGVNSVHGTSVKNVAKLVQQYLVRPEKVTAPSEWLEIAVGIAMLSAAYAAQIQENRIPEVDVAVVSGDLIGLMSAWYAREWGLPIHTIVCCSNENCSMWDLVMQGQLRTDAVSKRTSVPAADVSVPIGLERLIYACGGTEEVYRYLEIRLHGRVYRPGEEVLEKMRQGLFVSVVSQTRMANSRNNGKVSASDALMLCGIQDYRARTGATRTCILLKET